MTPYWSFAAWGGSSRLKSAMKTSFAAGCERSHPASARTIAGTKTSWCVSFTQCCQCARSVRECYTASIANGRVPRSWRRGNRRLFGGSSSRRLLGPGFLDLLHGVEVVVALAALRTDIGLHVANHFAAAKVHLDDLSSHALRPTHDARSQCTRLNPRSSRSWTIPGCRRRRLPRGGGSCLSCR